MLDEWLVSLARAFALVRLHHLVVSECKTKGWSTGQNSQCVSLDQLSRSSHRISMKTFTSFSDQQQYGQVQKIPMAITTLPPAPSHSVQPLHHHVDLHYLGALTGDTNRPPSRSQLCIRDRTASTLTTSQTRHTKAVSRLIPLSTSSPIPNPCEPSFPAAKVAR